VTAYWYLTRGTGIVALILLTVSVALGIANVLRMRLRGAPRFVTLGIHRSVSLLAVAFVGVHVLTSVIDGYVPISVVDAVVPFSSAYHPFWIGLGAIALDLVLAVVITSLLRRRFGYRVWRSVHWTAYASWPIALVHSLGTGSDAGSGWMTVLTVILAGAVTAAVLARLSARKPAIMSPWPARASRQRSLGRSPSRRHSRSPAAEAQAARR
jgi:predicted ferric reductase